MAELADALDSGSNGRKAVQVQVLLPAPNENTNFDYAGIKIGVFLLTKTEVFLNGCDRKLSLATN